MPIYIFEHPETGEVVEVVQRMKDKHEYTDDDGTEWKRVYTSPQASIDTKIDPFSSKNFVEKTRDKKGTLGEIWDAAAEASEKRKQKLGKDPVKEKYFKEYSEQRKGLKHQNDPTRKDVLPSSRANPFESI